jgi:hypothetical protein
VVVLGCNLGLVMVFGASLLIFELIDFLIPCGSPVGFGAPLKLGFVLLGSLAPGDKTGCYVTY